MGENCGFSTAEESVSGVENRSEGSMQNAAQKQREMQNRRTGVRGLGVGREGPVTLLAGFPDAQEKEQHRDQI